MSGITRKKHSGHLRMRYLSWAILPAHSAFRMRFRMVAMACSHKHLKHSVYRRGAGGGPGFFLLQTQLLERRPGAGSAPLSITEAKAAQPASVI